MIGNHCSFSVMKTSLFLVLALVPWTMQGELRPAKSGLAARDPLARSGKDSNLSQEPGAIYFGDLLTEPVRLRLPLRTEIYHQLNLERWLGTILPGREVTVEAMAEKAYRIRGKATHGDVVGWVSAEALKLNPELVEKLKKLYERQKEVSEMIANKQVGLGMTLAEVRACLGTPSRVSAKVDADGKSDVVEYSVYDKVTQYQPVRGRDGQLFQAPVTLKVETGVLTITLKNDQVTSIEETKGQPLAGSPVKIVPPPIVIPF